MNAIHDHCDCPLEGDTPASVERCGDVLESGEYDGELICSRPADHDGPHSACTRASHPLAVWDP